MKLSLTQTSFTSGKIGEHLAGRADISQAASSVLELVNGNVLEQGPVVFRAGTENVAITKHANGAAVLWPFRFSVSQALIIEAGDKYLRFYLEGSQITREPIAWVTAIDQKIGTIVNDPVTPTANRWRCIEAHTSGVFADDVTAGLWEATTAFSDVAYEIPTPYTSAILKEISFVGSADVMYLAHRSLPPMTLSRYANDDWRLEEIIFTDGPYLTLNADKEKAVTYTSGTPAAVTCLVATFVVGEDEGKLISLRTPATNLEEGVVYTARIIAVSSETVVTVEMLADAPGSGDEFTYWQLGAFSGQNLVAPPPPAPPLEYLQVSNTREINEWQAESARLIEGIYTRERDNRWVRSAGGKDYEILITSPECFCGEVDHRDLAFSVYPDRPIEAIIGVGPDNHWDWRGALSGGIMDLLEVSFPEPTPGEVGVIWPGVVALYQERLVFGSTNKQPSTLFFSVTADYKKFSPVNEFAEVLDDSGFVYTLAGGPDVDEIAWIRESTTLMIGTSGAEYAAVLGQEGTPITPTTCSFTVQSERGSYPFLSPVVVGGKLLFVQRMGTTARAMDYDIATGRFISIDITKLNDEILPSLGRITGRSFSPEPSNTVLYAGNNGAALVTYEPDDQVTAWSNVDIGGSILATTCVPSYTENQYSRYVIVKRENQQCIEKFSAPAANIYLDGATKYTGVPSTLFYLPHMKDVVVTIVNLDTGEVSQAAPYEGWITLEEPVTNVVFGRPYEMRIKLGTVDTQLETGATQNKQKRVLELMLQVLNSQDISVGVDEDTLYPLDLPEGSVTGRYAIDIDDDFDLSTGSLYLKHASPTPCTIIAATREIEFRD